jgi:hypothetical protein
MKCREADVAETDGLTELDYLVVTRQRQPVQDIFRFRLSASETRFPLKIAELLSENGGPRLIEFSDALWVPPKVARQTEAVDDSMSMDEVVVYAVLVGTILVGTVIGVGGLVIYGRRRGGGKDTEAEHEQLLHANDARRFQGYPYAFSLPALPEVYFGPAAEVAVQ